MGQRSALLLALFFAPLLLAALGAGCDRSDALPRPESPRPAGVTVASLVPAATDLIIGMGAGEQLVAVSRYDRDRQDTRGLPLVGDYLSTDWEQLAALRPDVMIIQMAPDRMPRGLLERAQSLNIRLVNVQINRLEDVFTTLDLLGAELNQPQKAAAAAASLRQRLDAVRQRVADRPRVPTLLTVDAKAENTVGRDNFLNDLLEIAGGENVLGERWGPWPRVDREMLLSLQPQAVLQLVLDDNEAGRADQDLARQQSRLRDEARRVWQAMPDLPAVRHDRVYILSERYLLLPGYHVADAAELFARCLHPE